MIKSTIKKTIDGEECLSVKEAARVLGLSNVTMQYYISTDRIKAYKVDGANYLPKESIDYLRENVKPRNRHQSQIVEAKPKDLKIYINEIKECRLKFDDNGNGYFHFALK